MIRIALAVAAVAIGASVVAAQQDPIAARKALMKGIGDQNRIAGEMIDAKRPFDLNAAKTVLTTFGDNAAKMPDLFPDTSKAGDTAALPAVWENKADFNAKMAKFSADAKAAAAQGDEPRHVQGGDGRGAQELRRLPSDLPQAHLIAPCAGFRCNPVESSRAACPADRRPGFFRT